MKKALIIALILLVAGALLVGAGWVLLQKYPVDMNTVKDSVYEYGMDEVPTQIQITTLESRVELRPTTEDQWKVACMDKEDLYHIVELKDGVLTIKQIDVRAWYDRIGIFNGFQDLSVIVYLPVQIYESLVIHSVSGSIKVQEGFVFSNASLQNTSGSISCSSRVTGSLNIKNTSGSITVDGSVGGNLNVKNTSGSIRIWGGINGDLNVTNGSGSIEVKNATPTSATVKNTSGGIDLRDVICQGNCEISNTSGSIELERCDALSFNIVTISGGIRASLLSAKTFDCHSTSGGIHVPKDGNGGIFKAKSTSGGIRVTVVD